MPDISGAVGHTHRGSFYWGKQH